jgi:hypothetical protein
MKTRKTSASVFSIMPSKSSLASLSYPSFIGSKISSKRAAYDRSLF